MGKASRPPRKLDSDGELAGATTPCLGSGPDWCGGIHRLWESVRHVLLVGSDCPRPAEMGPCLATSYEAEPHVSMAGTLAGPVGVIADSKCCRDSKTGRTDPRSQEKLAKKKARESRTGILNGPATLISGPPDSRRLPQMFRISAKTGRNREKPLKTQGDVLFSLGPICDGFPADYRTAYHATKRGLVLAAESRMTARFPSVK